MNQYGDGLAAFVAACLASWSKLKNTIVTTRFGTSIVSLASITPLVRSQ